MGLMLDEYDRDKNAPSKLVPTYCAEIKLVVPKDLYQVQEIFNYVSLSLFCGKKKHFQLKEVLGEFC